MREIKTRESIATEQLGLGLQAVLIKAGQEAAKLHYPTIGTEFLLLGLLKDGRVGELLA